MATCRAQHAHTFPSGPRAGARTIVIRMHSGAAALGNSACAPPLALSALPEAPPSQLPQILRLSRSAPQAARAAQLGICSGAGLAVCGCGGALRLRLLTAD